MCLNSLILLPRIAKKAVILLKSATALTRPKWEKTVFHFKIIWTLRRSASRALSINGVDAMAILSSSLVGVALSTDCNAEGNKKQKGYDETPKIHKRNALNALRERQNVMGIGLAIIV